MQDKMKFNSNTVIKKSVEMVKNPMQLTDLNKGLNLQQQRFFNMAILSINEDGISEYGQAEYKAIFKEESDNFFNKNVRKDITALGSLGLLLNSEEEISWNSLFESVKYNKVKSKYIFTWSRSMIKHVQDLKNNYIQQDLEVLAHFKNKYSFIWYDFFKSNYRQWKWTVSKEQLIKLLNLYDKKSYLQKHSMLYKQCIDEPLKEINKHTEFCIECKVIKTGRTVTDYEFERKVTKEVEFSVTESQLNVLKEISDRYGDTDFMTRKIMDLALYDAEAVPYLYELLIELKAYKRFIDNSDSFTKESFNDIVAMAIQKDNAFKNRYNKALSIKKSMPTIDTFLENTVQDEQQQKKNVIFYNWLDERE